MPVSGKPASSGKAFRPQRGLGLALPAKQRRRCAGSSPLRAPQRTAELERPMDDLQHAISDIESGASGAFPSGAEASLVDLEQLIQAHQDRLRHVQRTLTEQIEQLAEELDGEDIRAMRAEVIAGKQEIEQKTERLAQFKSELEQLQNQFAAAQEQMREEQQQSHQRLQTWETELETQSEELTDEIARLRESQRELALLREEFAVDAQHLARGRERMSEKMRQLDEQQDRLAAERQQLLDQMEAERASHREERNRLQHLADNATGDADPQAAAAIEMLRQELAECQQQLETQSSELIAARAELLAAEERLLHTATEASADQLRDLADERDLLQLELTELRADFDRLQQELDHAHTHAGSQADDVSQELSDLRQRYQMAIDDLRGERARSVSLEHKLANARSGNPIADSQGMDWESQKRRLLAALEADFDDGEEEDVADRLTIEDAIRRTDAAVVAKEQEIAELRELLNQQSTNLGNVAVGAAAIADLLDQDELIQQERENLQQLKQQLQEKSRKSEVELSMERAAIARERQELEEKTRELEDELERIRKGKPQSAADADADRKSQRGRWFKRLGLKDDEK